MSGDVLRDLAARALRELELFDYPPREWVPPAPGVLDVAIIGGGQNGIAIGLAMQRARIPNILVLDEGEAGREGPWITYARMQTLRTLKTLPGPALGIPNLAFRSWFEAQYGESGWEALSRAPKEMWMRYLVWLRQTLAIPFANYSRVTLIEPSAGLLRLHVDRADGRRDMLLARKVVLATGIQGGGGMRIPDFVATLPRDRWAHTAEEIDFASLAGRRVAVLGAGASAFDNAATALEAGAARVDLYLRRAVLPEVNSLRWMEFEGLFRHFAELDDLTRWRFMRRVFSMPVPPPADTLLRAQAHGNFHMHFSAGWRGAVLGPDGIAIDTEAGPARADFLILGTGFTTDLSRRPELAAVAPHVAFWRDRLTPPRGEEAPEIAGFPYLGQSFQLVERLPGACPALADIHVMNNAALPSMGPIATGLNGMAHGVDRLQRGISRDFFLRNAQGFYQDFLAYDAADPNDRPAPGEPAPAPNGV
jgi:cation diffusion facilitator CzcD-associated flavoprotein CzcO